MNFLSRLFWALPSALFAAQTAIVAKLGVRGAGSNVATLVRTVVIVGVLGVLLAATGGLHAPGPLERSTWAFLVLSGSATGASWPCYFPALKVGEAARVARVGKLSVVLVAVIGTAFLGEQLSLRGWASIALIEGGAVLVALG